MTSSPGSLIHAMLHDGNDLHINPLAVRICKSEVTAGPHTVLGLLLHQFSSLSVLSRSHLTIHP